MTSANFADHGKIDAIIRFTEDWQRCLRDDRTEPPPIAEYVPDGARVRLAVLTDLVRIDLRHRWDRAGLGKRIAEYRKEFPEVEHSADLVDLICEEFLARRGHGPLELTDFLSEYPEFAEDVRARLAEFATDDDTVADTERAAALVAELTPGRRIDDFDLITDLGTGTLGRVFLARQRSMQRLVAVRLSAGRGAGGHGMARLDHPHLVRVFDQRLITDKSATATRLVYMQYLPGGTAAGVLAQRGWLQEPDGGALLLRAIDTAMEAKGEIRPTDSSVRAEIAALSWPETVAWVGRRLADALDYAEHNGVLHRNIKPANVLFTAEGIPKLADFAVRAAAPRSVANPEAVEPDSLPYRSPEQLAELLDPAAPAPGPPSDIYSLGALLWELLTGAIPFDDPPMPADPDARAETFATMVRLRERGITEATLARLPPDTPSTLRRVLLECLRADPKRRWRNGAELAAQLDLCLDARARELVDPAPTSLAYRSRGWLMPILGLCVGVPNVLASLYNINLNESLIIDRMTLAEQERYSAVGLINNLIAFPIAGLLLLFLTRRPLTIGFRLARGREYSPRTLAAARRDTLHMGDWAVWVPFAFWLIAGVGWPLAVAFTGVDLPRQTFLHFFTAQLVCAAIALAYPFFPLMVYAVRSVYPQLLVRGGIGVEDERQLRKVAGRANFYLGVAAAVPLLGVAFATFVAAADLDLVIVPVRVLSVGGILAFVLTYRLFRMLEADLLALERAIPQRTR
ncbi:serine/threonine protein kinase [Nocardia sp. NBC_00565]|uniref:serine/threonine-protein kinase n=1 Tax=Nocardia sp. NBC_00565 TaxID=2975993 RepID=UPI002E806B53|nr:serine/threonine-protein kinase [Nocardia sp. NBC_00565]WUC01592.1 serine/threonine protein kinase [Nocardia sp. NBC_00565]